MEYKAMYHGVSKVFKIMRILPKKTKSCCRLNVKEFSSEDNKARHPKKKKIVSLRVAKSK